MNNHKLTINYTKLIINLAILLFELTVAAITMNDVMANGAGFVTFMVAIIMFGLAVFQLMIIGSNFAFYLKYRNKNINNKSALIYQHDQHLANMARNTARRLAE